VSVPDSRETPVGWGDWPPEAKRAWLTLRFERASLLGRILGRVGLDATGVDGQTQLSASQLAAVYAGVVDLDAHPDYGPDLSRAEPATQRERLAARESRRSLVTMLLHRADMDPRLSADYSTARLTKEELAAIYMLTERCSDA
jgi:hypothetical protein